MEPFLLPRSMATRASVNGAESTISARLRAESSTTDVGDKRSAGFSSMTTISTLAAFASVLSCSSAVATTSVFTPGLSGTSARHVAKPSWLVDSIPSTWTDWILD
jgi:hypothetical protein